MLLLKVARLERGLAQLDVAKVLRTSPVRVALLERGAVSPKAEEREKLTRLLGVEEELLFREIDLDSLRRSAFPEPAQQALVGEA